MAEESRRYKALRAILFILGVLFCLSIVFVFVPVSTLNRIASLFMGSENVAKLWLQDTALFAYMLKVCYVAFFWIGLTFLLAFSDPRRYRGLVVLEAVGLFVVGLTCLIAGPIVGLPTIWYAGDGIPILAGAVLLLILLPAAKAG